MFCRKCGNELRDGDQFCSRCGEPVEIINVSETGEVVLPRKKATFKEGIAALFNKTFTFKGTSSRSEFNYGLLFLYLMGILVTWIVLIPVFNDMPVTGDTLEMTNYIIEQLGNPDLTSPYSIATLAISLI